MGNIRLVELKPMLVTTLAPIALYTPELRSLPSADPSVLVILESVVAHVRACSLG